MRISRCPTTVTTANGEVQTHEETRVYVRELDIFFTVTNPRRYASSVIARKALRGSRIFIWVGPWSKTMSYWKWFSDSELRSDRGPGSIYGFLFIELISNSNIITAGRLNYSMDSIFSVQNKNFPGNWKELATLLGAVQQTKSHLHWQFLVIRQSLRRPIVESLHIKPSPFRNKWDCWESSTQDYASAI